MLKNFIKNFLKQVIFKRGSVVSILFGPLRGYKYIVNDNSGWASIYGGWEPEAVKVFLKILKPNQIIFDLGANTGIHSMLFSKLVGDSGKVFAFEPIEENIEEIEKVKELNNINNIFVINKAISDYCGTSQFMIASHHKQGSLLTQNNSENVQTREVTVATLDSLIQKGLEKPDFIKIDIEGAEANALAGFAKTITDCYPSLAIDLHNPEQDVKVGQFLAQHNYQVFRLLSPEAKNINQQKNLLDEIHQLDIGWPNPEGIWGTIFAIHPTRNININA